MLHALTTLFRPSRLTGPILDKELRVSSRRRRNYFLRFAYLALLLVFVVLVWVNMVRYRGNFAYRTSRMSEAGQAIITTVVWFQFIATQIIAIIMLSNSISDEIYHRTLGVLMTTPVNSFQIVFGKLSSKLLQVLLFLAISLPLLSIVRIFGGVPWGFLIAALCLNLTTVIFVATLSLFYSIFFRRAYIVIIVTVVTLALIFALIPFLTILALHEVFSERELLIPFIYANPYGFLAYETDAMLSARGGPFTVYWPINCALTLAASAVLFALAVRVVRRVALAQATGQPAFTRKPKNGLTTASTKPPTPIRRIQGSPIFWKELRHGLFGKRKKLAWILTITTLLLLTITYLLCAAEGHMLDDDDVHIGFGLVFFGLGLLFSLVIPATAVTSEKETGSWPLLLATTVGAPHIFIGKFLGTLRRTVPVWLLLFLHLALFILFGYIHPIAWPLTIPVVLSTIIFLTCSGLYFSARFKKTTTAVIANFAFVLIIWCIIPLILALSLEICDASDDAIESYMSGTPFCQIIVILEKTADYRRYSDRPWEHRYYWPHGRADLPETLTIIILCALGYLAAAFLFAWRAQARFRRRIF